MTDLPPFATLTRLEKAAVDNGFDRVLGPEGRWLAFASSQAPLRVWLTASPSGAPLVAAFSQGPVADGLAGYGPPAEHAAPPAGAVAGRACDDVPTLHRMIRRAFQLSRTLPDALLHEFERQAAHLPRATEAERLVVQRVGQDLFRAGLIEYWEGRCAVTGLAVVELLRASHIKPWSACATDGERLDIFNGLLLAPHLDAAFDRGFITFEGDGRLRRSSLLTPTDAAALGVAEAMRLTGLQERHDRYMTWHREQVFRAGLA